MMGQCCLSGPMNVQAFDHLIVLVRNAAAAAVAIYVQLCATLGWTAAHQAPFSPWVLCRQEH